MSMLIFIFGLYQVMVFSYKLIVPININISL